MTIVITHAMAKHETMHEAKRILPIAIEEPKVILIKIGRFVLFSLIYKVA